MTAPVTSLDSRRPISCPHCFSPFTPREIDVHIRFECRVLAAKRAHPSTVGADA